MVPRATLARYHKFVCNIATTASAVPQMGCKLTARARSRGVRMGRGHFPPSAPSIDRRADRYGRRHRASRGSVRGHGRSAAQGSRHRPARASRLLARPSDSEGRPRPSGPRRAPWVSAHRASGRGLRTVWRLTAGGCAAGQPANARIPHRAGRWALRPTHRGRDSFVPDRHRQTRDGGRRHRHAARARRQGRGREADASRTSVAAIR